MRGKEIITKLIIPGAIAMIICLIVHPMCMNGEILDWRKLLGQGKCLVCWYLN